MSAFARAIFYAPVFERVVGTCIVEGLVGGESFSVDASLIQADVDPARLAGQAGAG